MQFKPYIGFKFNKEKAERTLKNPAGDPAGFLIHD